MKTFSPWSGLAALLCLLALPGSLLRAASEIDDVTARWEMARVLRDGGQFDAAEAAYRKVLEQAPDHAAARGELAELLIWNKKPEEAQQVLELLPKEQWNLSALAAAAQLEVQGGRFSQAEERVRELVAADPSDKNRFFLASVLSWQKHYEESLSLLADLVEKNPADVQLRRTYAQVLGWAGKNEEAATQWKKSLAE